MLRRLKNQLGRLSKIRQGFPCLARGCHYVLIYGLILAFLHAEMVWALPSGGTVVGGGAVIDTSGGTTTITQSTDRAIINWQDFSVDAGELAKFIQPGANAAVLNRVIGNIPSSIMGEIQANGRVFLLNKNGVVIGGGAVIDTNGFVASTLDLPDADFMDGGDMTFRGDSAAAIVNLGQIEGGSGNVVLIARQIENAGQINTGGQAVLAAGGEVYLQDDSGLGLVQVAAGDDVDMDFSDKTAISNSGAITAAKAQLEAANGNMYELAINNDENGVINALNVVEGQDGRIILSSDGGRIEVNGAVTAQSSDQSGGSVDIRGGTVIARGTVTAKKTDGVGGSVTMSAAEYLHAEGEVDVAGTTGAGGQAIFESGQEMGLHANVDASSVAASGGIVNIEAGGKVESSAALNINVDGQTGGQILTDAGGTFTSGIYSAVGTGGQGGQILFAGNVSTLNARLNASGVDGGQILLGGDWQGGKNLADEDKKISHNSQATFIGQGTQIVARATGADGGGGEIVIWSDGDTHYYGSLLDARPGTLTGTAGSIEVSGSSLTLLEGDNIFAGYNGGREGTVLIDPKDLYITDITPSALNTVKMAMEFTTFGYAPNGSNFGESLALNSDGSILVVGSTNYGRQLINLSLNAGSVYIFSLNTGDDSAMPNFESVIDAYASTYPSGDGEGFGSALALNGDGSILAIGAANGEVAGAAYGDVFLYTLDTSDLSAGAAYRYALTNNHADLSLSSDDDFGRSLAMNNAGTLLAVGASRGDTGGSNRGEVYLFNLDPTNLLDSGIAADDASLTPDYRYVLDNNHADVSANLTDLDEFGYSVAFDGDGDVLAVGVPYGDTSSRGAAFLFSLDTTAYANTGGVADDDVALTPTFEYYIDRTHSEFDIQTNTNFGGSVALNGDGSVLAIGSWGSGVSSSLISGDSVSLFELDPGNLSAEPDWILTISGAGIFTSGGTEYADFGIANEVNQNFGRAVAMDDAASILFVGAENASFHDSSNSRGAIYSFSLDGSLNPTFNYNTLNRAYGVTSEDRFGSSIAMNDAGSILVIGSEGFGDGGGTLGDNGAVYIFGMDETDLYTTPTYSYRIDSGHADLDLDQRDYLGSGIALNAAGDILAVGAREDDDSGANDGAVYMFKLNPADLTATPDYRLKLTDVSATSLGASVALNSTGNIMAVGANKNDASRGAVYIFSLNATNFLDTGIADDDAAIGLTKEQIIDNTHASLTLAASDNLGESVALNDDGDVLAAGAWGVDEGGSIRGRVYLFSLDTGSLSTAAVKEYELDDSHTGFDLVNSDVFGYGVALNNDATILAVGGNDKVWMFKLDPSNLSNDPVYRTIINRTDPGLDYSSNTYFGRALGMNGSGSILAIGAYEDSRAANDMGSVALFSLNTTNFLDTVTYAADSSEIAPVAENLLGGEYDALYFGNNDGFGGSLAFNTDGSIMAVGAPTSGAFNNQGSVFIFSLDTSDRSSMPTFEYSLSAETTFGLGLNSGSTFGSGIALNGTGDILAVGAMTDSEGGSNRGAVYMFNLDLTDLTRRPDLGYKIDNTHPGFALSDSDYFGSSVALNNTGNILAVGALGGGTDGRALLFALDETDLSVAPAYRYTIEDGTVTGLTTASNDEFGSGVALNGAGDILAVGASSGGDGGSSAGAVFLFNLNTANILNTGGVAADDAALEPTYGQIIDVAHDDLNGLIGNGGDFGASVALNDSGSLLAVGASSYDADNTNDGAVFVFTVDTGDLTSAADVLYQIYSNSGHGVDFKNNTSVYFGASVALTGDGAFLAAGAAGLDDGQNGTGGTFLFNLTSSDDTTPTFAYAPSADQQLDVDTVATILSAGNNLILQANNDIYLQNNLTVANGGGDGGNLTLQAGRSLLLNGSIITDDGDLTLIANDLAANGVVDAQRDAGDAAITMAGGTSINVGSGTVSIQMRDGTGKTNFGMGDITLQTLSGTGGWTIDSDGGELIFSNTVNVGSLTVTTVDNITANNTLTTTGLLSLQNSTQGVISLANNLVAGGNLVLTSNDGITIDDISITASGDIDITATTGALTVQESGGSSVLQAGDGQAINLTATAGAVSITGGDIGDVSGTDSNTITIDGNSIALNDTSGALVMDSNGDNITITSDTTDIDITASGGNDTTIRTGGGTLLARAWQSLDLSGAVGNLVTILLEGGDGNFVADHQNSVSPNVGTATLTTNQYTTITSGGGRAHFYGISDDLVTLAALIDGSSTLNSVYSFYWGSDASGYAGHSLFLKGAQPYSGPSIEEQAQDANNTGPVITNQFGTERSEALGIISTVSPSQWDSKAYGPAAIVVPSQTLQVTPTIRSLPISAAQNRLVTTFTDQAGARVSIDHIIDLKLPSDPFIPVQEPAPASHKESSAKPYMLFFQTTQNKNTHTANISTNRKHRQSSRF